MLLLVLGVSCALVCYYLFSNEPFTYFAGHVSLYSLCITYGAVVVIGSLFARDKEMIHARRLFGMKIFAGSMANHLRTPLASIHLQTELQEKILDQLAHSAVQQDLKDSLNKINRDLELSQQMINRQLTNIRDTRLDTSGFCIQTIEKLIRQSLEEYPYADQQHELIRVDYNNDYPYGSMKSHSKVSFGIY